MLVKQISALAEIECVAGVCSCGHAPRLPTPRVSARVVAVEDELFVNVTWSLPPPAEPLRLPPSLKRASYFVSIGKQMVSDAHPSPWFAHTVTRRVPAKGSVILGDRTRWVALPMANARRVRMLARVSVIDDRGCSGPPGNGTVDDPADERRTPLRSYAGRVSEIVQRIKTGQAHVGPRVMSDSVVTRHGSMDRSGRCARASQPGGGDDRREGGQKADTHIETHPRTPGAAQTAPRLAAPAAREASLKQIIRFRSVSSNEICNYDVVKVNLSGPYNNSPEKNIETLK
ncbi:hypothetical protein EVAR_16242_1 [Eumeta japonica]|uniref:Uncharacterized protein n=1 Tax=Eumeta variegata TaxID=151549 RepID=A0A4C1U6X1_EUMVA|nr:hypothetical protein EVAR_16242_1 [Eumeta japonica]